MALLILKFLLAGIVLYLGCIRYLIRIPEIPTRVRAWRNRRRHPELNRAYRAAWNADKIVIAQEMLVRDRLKLRDNEELLRTARYPDVFDYHIPPGRIGWQLAWTARKWRVVELHNLKQRHVQ